jgi:hypothetical protein
MGRLASTAVVCKSQKATVYAIKAQEFMAEICNQKNEKTWEMILKSVAIKDKATLDKVLLSSRNHYLKPHDDDGHRHEHVGHKENEEPVIYLEAPEEIHENNEKIKQIIQENHLDIEEAEEDDQFNKFAKSISGIDRTVKYPEISIKGNIILTKNRLYD